MGATSNLKKAWSMFGSAMGGLKGGSNVASWMVAGTAAYFLWVKPSQDLKRLQNNHDRASLKSDPNQNSD